MDDSTRQEPTRPSQGDVAEPCALSCTSPGMEELVRDVLIRIADRWSLLVIEALEDGELRFSHLRERVGGISQKMLTQTLRQLERDGFVTRRVHAAVPPRVDYRLTPLGESLGLAVCGIWTWVASNAPQVEQARRAFDATEQENRKPVFPAQL